MKKQLLLILSCLLVLSVSAQRFSFVSEFLTFELHADSTFTTSGNYIMKNNTTDREFFMLSYPFPQDSYMGEVTHWDIKGNVENVRERKTSLMLRLNLAPGMQESFWATYTQKCLEDSAKYIITTTQHWKKPLELAEYTLIVDDCFEVSALPFTPDRQWDADGKQYFFFHKENLMPEKDFVFKYKYLGK